MSAAHKRHFYNIARSSTFEVVSILQILLDQNLFTATYYEELYEDAEIVSKMLPGLIRAL